jgi:hypothetical protein
MNWTGHVACTEEIKTPNILLGRQQEKRPLLRPRSRWEDKIQMNVKKQNAKSWTEFS